MNNMPLVSIGMPVYNAESFLPMAINALLSQRYGNYELIICDNCSSDSTEEICKAFADKDKRIKYYRNDENIGQLNNMELSLAKASGKYFMWAAYDDLWEASYIEECVNALENYPEALMCCTAVGFIDENGDAYGYEPYAKYDNPDLSQPDPVGRALTWLDRGTWVAIYGLFKRDALQGMRFKPAAFGPDTVFMFELLLKGFCIKIEKRLFYYRVFRKRTYDIGYYQRASLAKIDMPDAPYISLLYNCLNVVRQSELNWRNKLRITSGIISLAATLNPGSPWPSRMITMDVVSFVKNPFKNRKPFLLALIMPFAALRKILNRLNRISNGNKVCCR